MFKKTLAAIALLTLTACGVSEVDIDVVEEEITTGVKEQLNEDATVDCPDQVDWNTGETFACDVEFSGGTTKQATVEMLDDDGQVNWSIG